MVFKLHPDYNPYYETYDELKGYYEKVLWAYGRNDVRQLEILEHGLNDLLYKLGIDGDVIERKARRKRDKDVKNDDGLIATVDKKSIKRGKRAWIACCPFPDAYSIIKKKHFRGGNTGGE